MSLRTRVIVALFTVLPTAMSWAGEIKVDAEAPAEGYRFQTLTKTEHRALRRRFTLPMDALSMAKTPGDLLKRAVLEPMPDPARPLLAAPKPDPSAGDPFAPGKGGRSSRLGVLAELFASETGSAPRADEPEDLMGIGVEDPFADAIGPEETPDNSGAMADDELDTDPFAGDGASDDFEDDPFGF